MFERALIIETSGRLGQVAVASGERVLAERTLPEARRHARDLAALAAELLREQNWKPADLTGVVVDIGPGSFTGLRVGLASAKVLAYATRCPLLGVPAFRALVLHVPAAAARVEVIADALQGQVYCQPFVWHNDRWGAAEPIRIKTFEQWRQQMAGPTTVIGPGVGLFGDRLREISKATVLEGKGNLDARSLLGAARLSPEEFEVSPWNIEPIYLRGSSAEEKHKANETQ